MHESNHHYDQILTDKKVDDEQIEERQQARCEKPDHKKRQNYPKIFFSTVTQSVKIQRKLFSQE